jgi:predicted transcriptional regulator of viral defense system
MMLQTMDYQETILTILKVNKGFITSEDLRKKDVPFYAFTYFGSRHSLHKEAKGFYSEESWIKDEYYLFQYRYPKYVFSYQSALFLFRLSDRSPEHLEVSGPKNYRPLGNQKSDVIRHVVRQDDFYSLGIANVQTIYGNTVRAYSPERTLLDLIKHRDSLDPEVFVKALKAFQARGEKNIPLLLDYAEKMGIKKKVYDLLEVSQ